METDVNLIRFSWCSSVVATAVLALPVAAEGASLFKAGNIVATVQLTSATYGVREFTKAGVQVQQIQVPTPIGITEVPRDIDVGKDGKLYLYNGTFSPYLNIYDPATDVWTSTLRTSSTSSC